jgi:signal transduction histidine kinase
MGIPSEIGLDADGVRGMLRKHMINWVTVIWSMVSAACFTLAMVHFIAWLHHRRDCTRLLASLATLSLAVYPGIELAMMNATTIAEFAMLHRRAHLAVFFALVSIVLFVQCYFRTGRLWLLWLVIGLRVVIAVLSYFPGPTFNFSEVTALESFTLFGQSLAVPTGPATPWARLNEVSAFLSMVFVADASFRLWKSGDSAARMRAWVIGGAFFVCITLSILNSALIDVGGNRLPYMLGLTFIVVAAAMTYQLSRDLLQAVRSADQLRDQTQSMNLAAEAARLVFWRWDIRQDSVWVSPYGSELYAIPERPRVGLEDFLEILHPDDRAATRREVESALAGDGHFRAEYRISTPDDTVRWIEARGQTEFNAKHQPVQLRGVSVDVTARKTAERESLRQQQELAHLSRISVLGELAGALAHELNQPLAAILGNSQVGSRSLKTPSPDLVELGDILDDITADTKRAGGIIHGMRAMLKKDAGSEPQPVGVNDTVTQVLSLLNGEMVSRKVVPELHLADNLPPALAGRVEIQQILINLVLNALDAMNDLESGGSLEVTTRRINGFLEILLRDTGPGVPAEMMDRLFEPFVSTKHGGLGLGLAISRSIAERFHGGLLVENDPRGGAVFRLRLPQAKT